MQTIISCMQCQAENGTPNFSSFAVARIPEGGVIEARCNRNHVTRTIIQQSKFEILADMAIRAIVDEYYRDAIVSFNGSIERLYEFFVEATCRKRGIASDVLKAAWKPLTNRSERQIGAFIAAYLIEAGEAPPLLSESQTKLRNAVVHKGEFPERAQAIGFGQAVVSCALPVLALLKSNAFQHTVARLTADYLAIRSRAARDAGMCYSTCSIPTFLCLVTEGEPDVEAAVEEYAKRPKHADMLREAHALGAMVDLTGGAAPNAQSEPEG